MSKTNRKQDALDYHSQGRPGKIQVIPTKPYSSQRDLTLAYSPGVAEPCLKIAENKEDVYKYIFWSGANKILEDLANNVQNDNPEP
jgi:malate dehydrogenase (oxaloacetate-decarboxylating)(NADP+)